MPSLRAGASLAEQALRLSLVLRPSIGLPSCRWSDALYLEPERLLAGVVEQLAWRRDGNWTGDDLITDPAFGANLLGRRIILLGLARDDDTIGEPIGRLLVPDQGAVLILLAISLMPLACDGGWRRPLMDGLDIGNKLVHRRCFEYGPVDTRA